MKEIFKKLADMGITPNAFYILDCVKEGIVPNNYVKASLEVTRLIRDNWLTQDLELTDKSVIFTTEIAFNKRIYLHRFLLSSRVQELFLLTKDSSIYYFIK
jgi:hypothetical protein